MIKVLHLTTSFGVGGAEGNLARLVCNMDKARFSNTIVAMNQRLIVSEQVRQERIPCSSLGMRRGIPNPTALARLLSIIRRIRPHVLQTWMYHADLMGLLAGKLANVPVIAWNIRCSLMETPGRWLPEIVRHALVHLSKVPDVVIANSKAGVQVHQAIGYKPRRWMWIPNSVDLDRFRPQTAAHAALCAELGISSDAVLVGLVARFDPMKDHANFINAARLLTAENPAIHFVLAGHRIDPSDPQLSQLIKSTGVGERFHLLGLRRDIEIVTAALDIASSSSSGEGSSNAVAEAMACGVPCVVTDVGDSALIVGDTGKVVPPRNSQALAQACRALLELSPQQRMRLGALARERVVERFSVSAVADSYQRLYEELAASAAVRTESRLQQERLREIQP